MMLISSVWNFKTKPFKLHDCLNFTMMGSESCSVAEIVLYLYYIWFWNNWIFLSLFTLFNFVCGILVPVYDLMIWLSSVVALFRFDFRVPLAGSPPAPNRYMCTSFYWTVVLKSEFLIWVSLMPQICKLIKHVSNTALHVNNPTIPSHLILLK